MTEEYKAQAPAHFTREGVCDAVKFGAGESYLSAFGVFLGGTPLQLGILATLPPLIGSITQIVAVWLLEVLPRRKDLVLGIIRTQALIWLPIAAIPFLFEKGWSSVVALIALVVLYQITIGLIAPMWSSWVGDLVSSETRGSFFGLRNKSMAIATFAGLMISAQILQISRSAGLAAFGFAALFLIAAVLRYRSSKYLSFVPDLPYRVNEDEKFSFWQFLARGRKSNFVKFVFFVAAMNFATFLSGPYYAPYMLRDLQFTYVEYAGLLSTSVLAQFLVLAAWGKMSDQFGNRSILAFCGWQVAINPLFWLVSSQYWFLVLVQVYSGVFWSGFNLASANFIYDVAVPAKRARCVAYFSIINGAGIFLGSFSGGALISYFGPYLPHDYRMWAVASPYLTLFLLSAIFRFAAVRALLGKFKEVRSVESIRRRDILMRMLPNRNHNAVLKK